MGLAKYQNPVYCIKIMEFNKREPIRRRPDKRAMAGQAQKRSPPQADEHFPGGPAALPAAPLLSVSPPRIEVLNTKERIPA
jgi:hypothetical protein